MSAEGGQCMEHLYRKGYTWVLRLTLHVYGVAS